jgi:hypothetical protein
LARDPASLSMARTAASSSRQLVTPSLPWNHREPLCGPPFPQVTPDRKGRSNRFSFGEAMRSPSHQVLIIAGDATIAIQSN